jgi:hypothetical protein
MMLDRKSGQYLPAGAVRSTADMTATVPYSDRERLQILVEALALSAKELRAMEEVTLAFVQEFNISRIEFFQEESEAPRRVIGSDVHEDRTWSEVLYHWAMKVGELI